MGNRTIQRWIYFALYLCCAVIVSIWRPKIMGIMIFLTFIIKARMDNLNKIEAAFVSANQQETPVLSHRQYHLYSQQYSMKKRESQSGVKDKPLTEAEKNVLYG